MDDLDTKQFFAGDTDQEVQEIEYDGSKDEFPHRPITNIKINDKISSGPKWPMFVLIGCLLVVLLLNIILLGVNGVTLTHLNTLDICDNSASTANTANTAGLTSNGGSTNTTSTNLTVNCNCSVQTTWSPELALQVSRILNATKSTAWKVDGIANYTATDLMNNQNSSQLLTQIGQMLYNQIGQVLTTAQDTAGKVDDIRSFTVDQTTNTENITDTLYQTLQKTNEFAGRLTDIVNTLANIKNTGESSAAVINDILGIADELLALQNASSIFNSITPVSCADIKKALPNSPSGYYHVNARNIYCNMDQLCGIGGGWTRIAYLDMSDASQSCPSGYRYYQQGSIRACGLVSASPSCTVGLIFPTNNLNYTKICGRVIGYQKGSTDSNNGGGQHNNLNSYYVDGVSITRGSPREHVWTFMSGAWENRLHNADCPCNTGVNRGTQSFIGNNYYCESGNPTQGFSSSLYNDPLWDGQLCRNLEVPCCTNPLLPWFLRDYGNVTSNAYLELRVCGDEGQNNEDSPFNLYELYIQ